MSDEADAGGWLAGRGRRKLEAVRQAIGMLGLDYGEGHVENLYDRAYRDGIRDAHAFGEQRAHAAFTGSEGAFDLLRQPLYEQAKREAATPSG